MTVWSAGVTTLAGLVAGAAAAVVVAVDVPLTVGLVADDVDAEAVPLVVVVDILAYSLRR